MLPIIFSLILGITHFWNEKITISQSSVRVRLLSFVSGISVAYVFLILLPEIYQGFAVFHQLIFVALLFGFGSAHIAEKLIYQHNSQEQLKEKLVLLHTISFFIYHLLIGVILVKLSDIDQLQSILFFLPILFYSSIGLISLGNIHNKMWEKTWVKIILASSTLLGVLIADFLLSFDYLFNMLFGVVVGVFLYISLTDFIPMEKQGKPIFFALGLLIYTIIIIFTINI